MNARIAVPAMAAEESANYHKSRGKQRTTNNDASNRAARQFVLVRLRLVVA